ncbi:MAG: hypothetical protein E7168_01875 [Firmicutes bacterium]|nr:hypothetical protein [Bacillota bacterium]
MAKKNIIESKNGSVKVKLRATNFKNDNSSKEQFQVKHVAKVEKVVEKKANSKSKSEDKNKLEKKVVPKKEKTSSTKVVSKKETVEKVKKTSPSKVTTKKIDNSVKAESKKNTVVKKDSVKKEPATKKVSEKKATTTSKTKTDVSKKKETSSTKATASKKKVESSTKTNSMTKTLSAKDKVSTTKKNIKKDVVDKKVSSEKNKKTSSSKAAVTKKKPVLKKKKVIRLRLKSPKLIRLVVLSVFTIILLCVCGYLLFFRHRSVDYLPNFDVLHTVVLDDTNIVSVGSKSSSNTNHIEKGKLVKYDERGNIIFEVLCSKGKNSVFHSVSVSSDGYIVVGSYVTDKDNKSAYIASFDKEGKLLWEKDYSILTDTEFYKVLTLEDGYVVVGESNGQTDEKNAGGAIIVKYDFKGEILWQNHFGKNQEAEFSSVAVYQKGIYAVGKSQKDIGVLVKFNNNGTYAWDKTYSYTDDDGFSDIQVSNNKFYIVGGKKILTDETDESRKTSNIDAILLCYNPNGDLIFEKTFGGSRYERYNAIAAYGNNIFVVGYSNSTDSGLKNFTDGKKITGVFVKYNINGDIEKKSVFGGSNNDNLTDIVTDNSNLYIIGYTNSKDGNLLVSGENGIDYFSRLIKVDSRVRNLFIK